jgi:glucokinase
VTDDAPACAVGLDVGGTKIAAGIVAFPEGRVLARRQIPTNAQRPGESVLADAVQLAGDLCGEATARGLAVAGIGIGVPELVNAAGEVTSDQSIAWRGLRVAGAFGALAAAVVDSDVRVAARAEACFGAGRGYDPLVYVTIGTGISHTLVQHGRPYAGARGNALVFASAPLSTICSICGAELHPVLEELASGPALVARYNAIFPGRAAAGQDVIAAARAGEPAAIALIRSAGAALGNGIAMLINVLDPAAVVVGGGLGLAGGLYWDTFVATAQSHIWAEAARDLPIVPAGLHADAGLIGAALTAWEARGTFHS